MTAVDFHVRSDHDVRPTRTARRSAQPRRRPFSSPWLWLTIMCVGSIALSLRPGSNPNPFQDEGLYLFMGHRMLEHITTGAHLAEYPGTYFSGAPGVYPILGALADSVGGVPAARFLSSLFVCVAIVAVYGIGSQLYGKVAGLVGAGAFVLCGSVIFVSHLATFDAMAMATVALALCLAIHSARVDHFLWAPVVGVILAFGFFVKYATAVYIPGVAVVGGLIVATRIGWGAATRVIVVLASAVAVTFFVVIFWAQDLKVGILSTTAERTPISPQPPLDMLGDIGMWVGPWLLLAVLGAVVQYRRWPIGLALLLFSVVGPLQQLRIGESTSLAKHVAFGLVFAAPLIGALGAALLRMSKWIGIPFVGIVAGSLLYSGLINSHTFATGWVDDREMVAQLSVDVARSPGKAILGEEPSAQRYALREETDPAQWNDTFSFLYGGKTGEAAYFEAIDQSHFGTIYLTTDTANGKAINTYLTDTETPYRLSSKVPFYRYGEFAGYYLVWTPKVLG
ncbi:hypothetical protein GCM10007304_06340 [Rhodococcoides trifolii]|uniref:Glycosyltransferase RgtA/B/C/D-like domain-containing protein n=1 Tax=Rhodococcoides trifolii TaxID=908250 RepID=A0A917CR04_9NOCA|nr:glycosyltransferase family 39 protein [Rhodococcus trifolii]GGF95208.1 hypothetical protein GCM10007304_06340 [Rhodococcus trifolii]